MTDDDRSLWDRAKDAIGFGDGDRKDDRGVDMERPATDASPSADEAIGGIDGAAEAASRQGTAGGMGASGAIGGAGAAGPTGVTGLEPDDPERADATADPGAVKTEYEMGHEPINPAHERVAESGVSRDPSERVEP